MADKKPDADQFDLDGEFDFDKFAKLDDDDAPATPQEGGDESDSSDALEFGTEFSADSYGGDDFGGGSENEGDASNEDDPFALPGDEGEFDFASPPSPESVAEEAMQGDADEEFADFDGDDSFAAAIDDDASAATGDPDLVEDDPFAEPSEDFAPEGDDPFSAADDDLADLEDEPDAAPGAPRTGSAGFGVTRMVAAAAVAGFIGYAGYLFLPGLLASPAEVAETDGPAAVAEAPAFPTSLPPQPDPSPAPAEPIALPELPDPVPTAMDEGSSFEIPGAIAELEIPGIPDEQGEDIPDPAPDRPAMADPLEELVGGPGRGGLASMKEDVVGAPTVTPAPDSAAIERLNDRIEELADAVASLDRRVENVERRPVAAPAADEVSPAQSSSAPAPGPGVVFAPLKPPIIEGMALRGVSRETAWIGTSDGMVEVRVGESLGDAGIVRSLQNYRGRWIAVTDKGIILPN